MTEPPSRRSRPDPVLARRASVARLSAAGQRAGYALFGAAMVLFVVGAARGFTTALTAAVTACLALGSAVLAPSIILSYAVKAAERDERNRPR